MAATSPHRTMAAMVDLLLRRAPAASGEAYDVRRGTRIVGRIMLSNGSGGVAVGLDLILPLPRGPHSDTRLRAYPRRRHEGVLPQLASEMKSGRVTSVSRVLAVGHSSSSLLTPMAAQRLSSLPRTSPPTS